jgi:hypothetical protein
MADIHHFSEKAIRMVTKVTKVKSYRKHAANALKMGKVEKGNTVTR